MAISSWKAETAWEPAADVYRTTDGWVIKLEIAGVRLGDIRIDLKEDQVVVSGTRRDWLVAEGCRQYSMEISYSPFERVFKLPGDLRNAAVSSECRDGMLLVHLACKRGFE